MIDGGSSQVLRGLTVTRSTQYDLLHSLALTWTETNRVLFADLCSWYSSSVELVKDVLFFLLSWLSKQDGGFIHLYLTISCQHNP